MHDRGLSLLSEDWRGRKPVSPRRGAPGREGRLAGRSGAGLGAAERHARRSRRKSPRRAGSCCPTVSGVWNPTDPTIVALRDRSRLSEHLTGEQARLGRTGCGSSSDATTRSSSRRSTTTWRRGWALALVAPPAAVAGGPTGSGGGADRCVEAAPHSPARHGGATRAAAGTGCQADAGCGRSGPDACAAGGRTARPGQPPPAPPFARPARSGGASARRGGAEGRDGLVDGHRAGPFRTRQSCRRYRVSASACSLRCFGRQRCVAASGLRGAVMSVRGGFGHRAFG